MDIFGKFKSVTEENLYDFYGISSLNIDGLDIDSRNIVDAFLQGFKRLYMEALRTRFGHWNPNGKKALTVDDMIKELRDAINDYANKAANKMSRTGAGFNMMEAVKFMRGEVDDSKKKAEEAHIKGFAENLSKFDNSKYPMIAKGVIQLHEARNIKEIILAIDHINDLQHWGGYILIDFIAGHRDPSDPEGNRVLNQIMEIKKHAKSPLEFTSKMSSDIRKIVQESERLRRAGL